MAAVCSPDLPPYPRGSAPAPLTGDALVCADTLLQLPFPPGPIEPLQDSGLWEATGGVSNKVGQSRASAIFLLWPRQAVRLRMVTGHVASAGLPLGTPGCRVKLSGIFGSFP